VAVLALLVATAHFEVAHSEVSGRAGATTLGLPPLEPIESTPALVDLGLRLFFDRRLSRDGSISCASCHIPEMAYSDGRAVAIGAGANAGTRNAISLLNVAHQETLFWDGRRGSLTEQATDPFFNQREHGLGGPSRLLQMIRADNGYVAGFEKALGISALELTVKNVGMALAAFERTLVAGDSEFDRFYYGNDPQALSTSARRGLTLFTGRAQCVNCHTITTTGALFSDGKFHSAGIGTKPIAARLGPIAQRAIASSDEEISRLVSADSEMAAMGRFLVTHKPTDIGHYKTPSLRNVAITGPYMHNGSVATLEDAVELELYYRGLQSNHPIVLTDIEKSDLVAFLRSLTSPVWPLSNGQKRSY